MTFNTSCELKDVCVSADFTHQQMFVSPFISGTKYMTKLSLGNPNMLNIIYLYMYIHRKERSRNDFQYVHSLLGMAYVP